MGGGAWRSWVWDPWLLLAELVGLQGLFYASLSILLTSLDWLWGRRRSLEQIFRYSSLFLRGGSGTGLAHVAFLLNAAAMGVGIWLVVGRAKLCLDFAASAHLIHLLLAIVYNGAIPLSPSWWLLQVICVALATLLAEFLCIQSDSRAIPINSFAAARTDL